MSTNSENPYAASSATPLPSLAGTPGTSSLAQSARLKQLNVARGILFFVGAVTIAFNIFQYVQAKSIVEAELKKEVEKLRQQGMMVDQAAYRQAVDETMNVVRIVCVVLVGLGVLYIIFGLIIKKFPVPVTITSLVLYVLAALIFAALDPESIAKGIIMKVIIVYALFRAVQAALAYEKERRLEGLADFG